MTIQMSKMNYREDKKAARSLLNKINNKTEKLIKLKDPSV